MPPAGLRLFEADLADPAAVDAVLAQIEPDAVVHLAGQSNPQQSRLDPGGTLRANVLGIVHVIDAARRHGLLPALLVVGSAEEYGPVSAAETPLSEDAPLRPASPYAVSKVAQGLLAVECGGAVGMRVVRTRTFHHTGPGRGEAFAESSFARQIAEIEAGIRPPVIHVGNLEAVRDFTDVRDVVGAYWALLQKGGNGQVFNVCSGRGRRIRELLDQLLALARVEVEIRVDPERLRPADVPVLVGDPSRLRTLTGWEPRIPLETTLRDLLADRRRRVGARSAE
jgi:GDP-4-dehydro-6-deoxy-D-mannose reductase